MRTAPPALPGAHANDSPLDRALALMLAGEREAALRWSAAAVEQDPTLSSALIITCRLLADLGRGEAAREGLVLGLERAIDAGNLPLAVAAVGDLRKLGLDVHVYFEEIADAFCKDSPRLSDVAAPPPPLPANQDHHPLSSHLMGPALLSKATEIIHEARRQYESVKDSVPPLFPPIPLFSALDRESLRALVEAFEMITVAAGRSIIREGEEGAEAYIVARGELEARRTSTDRDTGEKSEVTLARLTNGALFGEMALLSRAPRAAAVVACRASILLVARRDALEAVAERRPAVGVELAAHCRRRMVANLLRTSPVLLAVDSASRPALVERFDTRVFEKAEKLIAQGEDPSGLHLIASGEVAVVGHEGAEPFVIATLGPGDIAGEVGVILRRKSNADVVAVHPTVTLYLPREDFIQLIREQPAVLAGLYLLAIEREEETSSVFALSTTSVADDYVLV